LDPQGGDRVPLASWEVVSVRLEQVSYPDHDHVSLIGYFSPHIEYEPIMLSVERTLQRMDDGERFYIKDGDAEADLKPGKCSVCGHEPYLRTTADAEDEEKLLGLIDG
jgi:hypothetical protein